MAVFCAPIAAADLIGIEGGLNGDLVRVSTVDGSTSTIGSPGVDIPFAGLATRPSDGAVFGLTVGLSAIPAFGGPRLYRLDPTNGAATLVGLLSSPNNDVVFEGAFAISPDGTGYGLYYGNSFANPADPFYLISIDLDTAAFSIAGLISVRGINGMVFRPDGKLVGFDDQSDTLVEIDPMTGATTTIGPLGITVGIVGGLAIHDGIGYLAEGQDGVSRLYRVNLYTGATTLIGDMGDVGPSGIHGLTGIPEPGALWLLAIGAVFVRRRRARA